MRRDPIQKCDRAHCGNVRYLHAVHYACSVIALFEHWRAQTARPTEVQRAHWSRPCLFSLWRACKMFPTLRPACVLQLHGHVVMVKKNSLVL